MFLQKALSNIYGQAYDNVQCGKKLSIVFVIFIDVAGKALYQAKQEGRNRTKIVTAINIAGTTSL